MRRTVVVPARRVASRSSIRGLLLVLVACRAAPPPVTPLAVSPTPACVPGPHAHCARVDLRNRWQPGQDFTGSDFSGANLEGASLSESILTEADFRGANLSNTKLFKSDARHARFDGARLAWASLWMGQFQGATFDKADLENANFADADLTGAQLGQPRWSDTVCPDRTNSDAHEQTCVGHLAPLKAAGRPPACDPTEEYTVAGSYENTNEVFSIRIPDGYLGCLRAGGLPIYAVDIALHPDGGGIHVEGLIDHEPSPRPRSRRKIRGLRPCPPHLPRGRKTQCLLPGTSTPVEFQLDDPKPDGVVCRAHFEPDEPGTYDVHLGSSDPGCEHDRAIFEAVVRSWGLGVEEEQKGPASP
jgi:hypothetical protein